MAKRKKRAPKPTRANSSKTGRFVSKTYAKRHPATTEEKAIKPRVPGVPTGIVK